MNEIKYKKYLDIDEQIELLQSRKLKITDSDKLRYYLQKYSYHDFVNGYNDFLFLNENRKLNIYKNNASEVELISIFNFDRGISSIILNSILDFERSLSQQIVKVICEFMIENNINGENENCCQILKISNNEHKKIFKKIKRKYINKELQGYIPQRVKKQKLNSVKTLEKYNDIEEIPIWTLAIHWGFGNIDKILNHLNKSLLKNISDNFSKDLDLKVFKYIISLIKKIRNRCCHNNVVYNFTSEIPENFRDFYKSKINQDIKKELRISDIVLLLDFLNKKTKNNLKLVFKKKVETYIEKEGFDGDIKTKLLDYINYRNM